MTKTEYEKVVEVWAKLNAMLGILGSVQRGETEDFGSEWLDPSGAFTYDKVVAFCYSRTLDSYTLLDQIVSKRRA
jgi:hypothetical protein